MLVHHEHHAFNIIGFLEIDVKHLPAAIFLIQSEDGEFSFSDPFLGVGDCHFNRCPAIITGIVGRQIGFFDNLINRQ